MAGEQKKGFLGGFKDWAEATETLITDQWPNKNNSLRWTNELSCEEQPRPLRNLFFFRLPLIAKRCAGDKVTVKSLPIKVAAVKLDNYNSTRLTSFPTSTKTVIGAIHLESSQIFKSI